MPSKKQESPSLVVANIRGEETGKSASQIAKEATDKALAETQAIQAQYARTAHNRQEYRQQEDLHRQKLEQERLAKEKSEREAQEKADQEAFERSEKIRHLILGVVSGLAAIGLIAGIIYELATYVSYQIDSANNATPTQTTTATPTETKAATPTQVGTPFPRILHRDPKNPGVIVLPSGATFKLTPGTRGQPDTIIVSTATPNPE